VTAAVEIFRQAVRSPIAGKKRVIFVVGRDASLDVFSAVDAALAAVVRTLGREEPAVGVQCLAVDTTASPDAVADAVSALASLPSEAAAYLDGRWQCRTWREVQQAGNPITPWRTRGAYLITGGAGGLGRVLAREIVRRSPQATLILVGRSALDLAGEAVLNELRAEGATVHYRRADVSDEADVDALFEWIREDVGAIHGVLHCAGVVRDRLAVRKTRDEVAAVLAPKVAGTMTLDRATAEMPLDLFVCFSSVAAAFGNVGQVDYAAANAFLDAFAGWRTQLVADGRRHGQTLAVDWPLWKESGIPVDAETEQQLFREFGLRPMPSDEGVQALYRSLATGLPHVLVLYGDEGRIRRRMSSVAQSSVAASATPTTAASAWSSLWERAVGCVRQVLAAVLDVQAERVQEGDLFERYGIDSILAVRLTAQLEHTFGPLSQILFFEHQSVRALAEYLVAHHADRLSSLAAGELPSRVDPARTPAVSRQKVEVQDRSTSSALDIAIVGLSGRYPGAPTVGQLWEQLKAGTDCVTEIPPERFDYRRYFDPGRGAGTIYSKWGGFIDGVDEFDPLFFNISPRDAELMDPQERLFLQCAYSTIEDAGYTPDTLGSPAAPGRPGNVGVFVGVMYEEYQLFGAELALHGRPVALSGNPSAIANRVSYFCNFTGPSMAVDTMCSSSLTAIHLACQSLRQGECEAAIAGGVNVSIHPNKYLLLSQGRFASSAGRCESFGTGGDGYVPAEGVGAVLLKPLPRALRDGDHIYGVIRGTAVNHGGKTNGFTVPNPSAQAEIISGALKQARIHPREISYIEAHGTGTSLGDPIEIAGLTRAFREATDAREYCAIGSLKSNIGHAEGAAGIAGVTKVLLQLQHRQLAPSLHARTLNPLIDFETSPFRVQQELTSWPQPEIAEDGATRVVPRIAGISSFGAGGSNAHVLIHEAPELPILPPPRDRDVVIVLSARSDDRLREVVEGLLAYVKAGAAASLRDLAYTLHVGRVAFDERLACVTKSHRDLESLLQGVLEGRTDLPNVCRGSVQMPNSCPMASSEDLLTLAQSWVQGAVVEWTRLYASDKARRVSLPTYPFARERYWVPKDVPPTAIAPAPPVPAAVDHLAQVFLRKEWTRQSLQSRALALKGVVLLLATSKTMPLASKLFTTNSELHVVPVNVGDADFSPEQAEELHRELGQPGRSVAGVVDCLALDPNAAASSERGRIRIVQRVLEADRAKGIRLLLLTARLYPVTAGPTTLRGAPLAGLYRMLGAEYQQVQSTVVDVDLDLGRESSLVEIIENEFTHADSGFGECAYRDGARHAPTLVPARGESSADAADPRRSITADDVFVVTGGTRGIGAAIASHLVARGVRKLVLMGREALPPREAWNAIATEKLPDGVRQKIDLLRSLLARGTQVRYFNQPLSDEAGLRTVVQQVCEQLGPITGVFHCAGVSGENPAFIRKSSEEIAAVCAPKITGLLTLDRVLAGQPLKRFVLFSSVSSVVPTLAAGQSDYAMANAFMDAYAWHQHSHGRREFLSIQWPAWGETGMAAGKMEIPAYTRTGFTSLTTDAGLELLGRVWSVTDPVVLAGMMRTGTVAHSELLRTRLGEAALKALAAPKADGPAPATDRGEIVEWLRGLFMSGLKLSAAQLKDTRPFDEFGVDSVMIAQLVRIMEKRVQRALSPSLLLEYSTIADLAGYFASAHPEVFGIAATPRQPSPPAGLRAPRIDVQQPNLSAAPVSSLDIAVVGIACRFPGASTPQEFWNDLAAGRTAIGPTDAPRWQAEDDRFFEAGWLKDIEWFDPLYFRMTEADVAVMDPQARVLLEESLFALADAGYEPEELSGEHVAVYVGGRTQRPLDMDAILKAPNPILGSSQNYLATNISRFFNFNGPSMVIDTGCSSAITAVQCAADALRSGRVTLALVAGVNLLLTSDAHRLFAERDILSRTGDFKIFDRQATGEVLGEGAGVVLLRRRADAVADGNRIYGVVRAIATNNDGRTIGPGSPNIHAQKQVIGDALAAAGLSEDEVGYIEVNGGGSPVVDAVEINVLSDAYKLGDRQRPSCFVGSVKPNIGHLLLASGIAGFIRCVLTVHHKQIPPFLSARDPLEYYDFEASRIVFNRTVVDWTVASGRRRIAAQSSYPDGGTNAHAIVEEFVPDASYRQERFAKPQPVLERRRFALTVPRPASADDTAVGDVPRAEYGRGQGMRRFLEVFAASNTKEIADDPTIAGQDRPAIQTAWGEFDEEST